MSSGPLSDPGYQKQLLDQSLRILTLLTDGVQSVHDWTNNGAVTQEAGWGIDLHARLAAIEAAIQAGNGAVPAQMVQDIADLKAAVSRIEAALKGA